MKLSKIFCQVLVARFPAATTQRRAKLADMVRTALESDGQLPAELKEALAAWYAVNDQGEASKETGDKVIALLHNSSTLEASMPTIRSKSSKSLACTTRARWVSS